jgi:hypothetical protein
MWIFFYLPSGFFLAMMLQPQIPPTVLGPFVLELLPHPELRRTPLGPPLVRHILHNLHKVVLTARPTASALEAKSRYGASSIGEKLEISLKPQPQCTTNILKSLALHRGLEPLFSP